jgi:RHS repeat-associated protein
MKPQRAHASRGSLFWLAFLPLIVLGGVLSNWIFLAQTAYAAPNTAYSAPGHLTAQQALSEGQALNQNKGKFKRPTSEPASNKLDKNASKNKPLPSSEPAAMHDGIFTLDDSFVLHRPTMKVSVATPTVTGTAIPAGTTPFQFKGSDGRLEVDLPRGSLDFAQAKLADGSAPVGQLQLQIHQIAGHSVASESFLGWYQIQVVDSQGHVVQGVQVVQPISIVYHYQPWEMKDLAIDPTHVRLSWPDLIDAARTAKTSTAALVVPMVNNATAHTLTAQTTVINSVMAASSPSIAVPTKPDLFEASGNSGQYSYSYPISVVPGPDGFMPQLALSYSSQSTNSRYSRTSPGGDEGDGWSLSLGSITMATYPGLSNAAQGTWYSINGVDGISDKMIPAGTPGQYVTEHYSHLHIVNAGSYWQVWGKDGTYYEFGNTQDSLQKNASGTYEWDVDKIVAPNNSGGQAKTMFIRYYQDSTDGGSTVRDAGIDSIQYGMATSLDATSLSQIMGTVGFYYRAPTTGDDTDGQGNHYATAYGTNYHCSSSPPSDTTLRCDDTVAYGSTPAPTQMPTLSLTSIVSYVGDDKNDVPAYKYSFDYQDTPYTTNYYDPSSDVQQAAAGNHLLTGITQTVYVAGTAYPRQPVEFGYTGAKQNSYTDHSQSGAGGHFSGQTFWSYLDWYEDLETGTGANISYATASANMQGTPYTTDSSGDVSDDRYDPLYCYYNSGDSDTSKRCTGSLYGNPNEMSWSVQVVTQISAMGTDSSGDTTLATTYYGYSLQDVDSSTMPVNSCNPITGTGVPDAEAACVTDTWVPGVASYGQDNDQNWANYYDAEFRGFNVVYTTTPANNLVVDAYFSTAGWFTPESNGANFNGGQRYEEKIYQGSNESDTSLLKETFDYYAGVGDTPSGNPYTGINTCNTGLSMTYDPCVVASLETKEIEVDGSTPANGTWLDTKYTYDDVSTSTGYLSGKYHNLYQEVITGSNLPSSVYPLTKKWSYKVTNGTDSNGVYRYDVNKATHSETDDASGHVWQCQDTTYDEGAASGIVVPAAGWPTTQKSYTTCGNSATALTSYTAYDQYGNTVATVDPLGVANPSLYSSHGCTASGIAYVSASWTAGHYTSCSTYDTTTQDQPTSATNVLGQTIQTNYTFANTEPLSSTVDLNGQTTAYGYTYDSTGNETIATNAPGESPTTYTSLQREKTSCTTSSALPCYEIDTNKSLYSGAITRTFYDQQGRAIETRTPGPTPGDDTVVATIYADENASVWKSKPFQVADGSGWLDPSTVTDINGNKPAGTYTFTDALGRTIATQDPTYGSTQEPGQACSWYSSHTFTSCTNYGLASAVSDSTTFEMATSTDANGHVTQSFTDAAGHVRDTQTNYGVITGTLALAEQVQTQYNALGKPTSVTTVDGRPQSGESVTSSTTTMTYDDTGRMLTAVDPDQGTLTYTYDRDSHMLSSVQTSGSNSRTMGYNYDLMGRTGCVQTAIPTINWNGACSVGNPLIQNTYDTTKLGTQGTSDFPVGMLTQSVATTYYPDSTSATVTEQFQHDQRMRLTNEQIQLGLPSGWNVSAGLPLYQEAMSYNDANQVTTTSTTDGSAGYSFTSIYDPTNGVQQGLSNNSLSTANLATLSYNEYAQLASITLLNGASSSPTSIASEQYSYDANQRPTSLSANWLPGSGTSGQILNQSRSYDNASNVTSLTTTFAAVPGQTGSGGAQTENFCYDEQNRLLWSGNGNWAAGTPQPSAGNGTCGSGTLGSTLGGSAYSASYTYTNLGQIWQGPLNHGWTQEQYLYCNSAAPHQLTGVYPMGTTCATMGSATALYSAAYDPWGNQTTRTTNGVTGTLSYDQSNRLTEWNAGSTSQEFYLYDATGNRILKRSITGTGTQLSVYSFGLEENDYSGTGVLSTQVHYYNLASHLIGSFDGTNTTYYMTDALDSVLTAFSQSAIQGEQVYGPFGASSYQSGTINTAKGYTGQVHDGVSGLDYYVARYYDPVMGMFLSVDTVQGNQQGMNPYQYVGDNPETHNDPSGHCWPLCTMLIGAVIGAAISVGATVVTNAVQGKPTSMGQIAQAAVVGAVSGAISGLVGPEAGPIAKIAVGALSSGAGQMVGNAMSGKPPMDGVAQATIVGGVTGGLVEGAGALVKGASGEAGAAEGAISEAAGSCGLSFRSDTLVATPTGEQAISTLNVGDYVQAYNPVTKTISTQTVQQVFINHDTDLMDVTLAVHSSSTQTKQQQAAVVGHGSHAPPAKTEVVHTTQKHPWLTTKGWITAGQLHLGNEVLLLDGTTATVVGLKIVSGAASMYDLTVSNVHTFAVGDGQFVVHNCAQKLETFERFGSDEEAASVQLEGKLSFKPGTRGPDGGTKWISLPGSASWKRLGSSKSYSKLMTILTKPGTTEWLQAIRNYKPNEPNFFGIPSQYLEEFNNRIVKITISSAR